MIILGSYLPTWRLMGSRSDLVAVSTLAFVTNPHATFTLCVCRDTSQCNLSSSHVRHYI